MYISRQTAIQNGSACTQCSNELQASKAAVLNFFETLRMELGDEVGITIATPGWIESEMTKGKHLSKEGTVEVDQDTRDVSMSTRFIDNDDDILSIEMELL